MKPAPLLLLLAMMLSACDAVTPVTPSATPVAILRPLATVALSPTPNAQQRAATQAAITPTLPPPTSTPIPSPTPYIGVFVGAADPDEGRVVRNEPLFAEADTESAACPDEPIAAPLASAWENDPVLAQRMGCPIQASFGFVGEVQVMENGVTYWHPDTRETWAIVTEDGVGRYWALEAPPEVSTEALEPPLGRFVPEGDVGHLWAGITELRLLIGYGLTPAQQADINLQRFQSGTMLYDLTSGQIFALLADGTAYGPYSAPPSAQ